MKSLLCCVAATASGVAGLSHAQGLTGPFAPNRWDNSPILDGATAVLDAVTLAYDVQLSGNGVTPRTAEFSAIAAETGELSFLYDYRAFHAFFFDSYQLTAFAEQADGSRQTVELVASSNLPEGLVQTGRVSLSVVAGRPYGVIVGGGNSDSNSVLSGSVTLSAFRGVAGNRDVADWSSTGIAAGTTDVLPAVEFTYDVSLPAGVGVTPRAAEYTNFAVDGGSVAFNWSFSRDHSFFEGFANLFFFSEGEASVTQIEVDAEPAPGGTVTTTDGSFFRRDYTLPVSNGGLFGVHVGGGNFDVFSFLRGSVTLSFFEARPTAPCPADFNNDGSVGDIFDLFDFLAALDAGCP